MSIKLLRQGHKAFQKKISQELTAKYQTLGSKQKPFAMLITCIDSRIMPEQLFDLEPGSIFCLRNIASLVKPNDIAAVSAIEFAVNALKVKDIIVMGHSNCGGINALINKAGDGAVRAWLEPWHENVTDWQKTCGNHDIDDFCQKQAAIASVENIKKIPCIKTENVTTHAWHCDIATARLSGYNPETKTFSPL